MCSTEDNLDYPGAIHPQALSRAEAMWRLRLQARLRQLSETLPAPPHERADRRAR
jgi:hypothetical protein